MSDFGGNFYITFLLSGVVELPNHLITPLLLKFFGRKTLYIFFMFILAFSAFAVIPSKAEWLKITFVLIGKFSVSTSWCIFGIQSSEIFPTIVRNTGLGVLSVVARIGSMSAPFMSNLVNKQNIFENFSSFMYQFLGNDYEFDFCYDTLWCSVPYEWTLSFLFTRN